MAGVKKKKVERTRIRNKKAKPISPKKVNSSKNPIKKKVVPINKKQPENQISIQKKQSLHKIEEKEIKKENKSGPLKIFILILLIIFGGVASFMFRNLYVYILSGLVIIGMISYLIIGRPKKKQSEKKEGSKPIKQPQIIKTKYMTDFDRFYNFIIERKKIPISKTAHHLKMPKKQVEEWAKILEERGLIKIYYPIIGDPELRCLE
jgi:hypothetical protein